MDNSDEALTPTTENWAEFELVTRKRKGKRKKAGRSNSLTESNVSSSHDSNQARTKSITGDVTKKDSVLHGVPYVEKNDLYAATSGLDMIRLDAQMHQSPQYVEQEELEYPLNTMENIGDDKYGIENPNPEVSPPVEIYNTRALSQYADTYELERFEKNALLIFNHRNVDGYLPRLGTEKDVAELESTFKNLGFEVQVEDDLTKDQIMDKIRKFTSQDFTDYGCVGVVVLSHGSKDGRIKAKDMPYSELEIVSQLQGQHKPTLLTKPRLFIVQACRGTKDIKGMTVARAYGIQKDLDEEVEPYTLPVEADMLVLHSSYIGKPSHRHELHGSWFIQSLCKKIKELSGSLDLEAIITEVKKEVAIDKWHVERNRRTDEMDINKQMPVSTSTLTRRLYLRRFGETPESVPDSGPTRGAPAQASVTDSSVPNTPTPVLYGPCFCFLDHFAYIKNCLSHHVMENPEDTTALYLLNLAATFNDDANFFGPKEQAAKLICEHLRDKGKDNPYYKYLYFYKN